MIKVAKIRFIFLVGMTLGLCSCNFKLFGTNTGNPGVVSDPHAGSPSPPIYFADSIGNSICSNLKRCFSGLDISLCKVQILQTPSITAELRMDSDYVTLDDLAEGERLGQVRGDKTLAQACLSGLDAVSCADSLVQNSYSDSTPNDLTHAHFILQSSSSCSQVMSRAQ